MLPGSGLGHAGVAVELAIAAMELGGTVHPPAGADPLVVLLSGTTNVSFLLSPPLFGVALLLLIAVVVGTGRA